MGVDVVAEKQIERDGYKIGAAYVASEHEDLVTPEQRGRFKVAFWKCFTKLAAVAGYKVVDFKTLDVALVNHFGEENGHNIAHAIERTFAERDELKLRVKELEKQREEWFESHRMITAGTQRG